MKLKEGNLAIDFEAEDIFGTRIRLSDYQGQRIVLSFFRHLSCPFCNVRVHKLLSNKVRLQRSGVQLILLFEASAERLRDSILHQGIAPWPLIGDPERKLYDRYAVEVSLAKMVSTAWQPGVRDTLKLAKTLPSTGTPDTRPTYALIPADFFIDTDFRIHTAHYGQHADDHVDLDLLRSFAGVRI